MFDDEFNLKIIHISEANIIKDKYEKNKDLFLLGQSLAKILSYKKFCSINYSKKSNKYIRVSAEIKITIFTNIYTYVNLKRRLLY